jgi:hypothetical protein
MVAARRVSLLTESMAVEKVLEVWLRLVVVVAVVCFAFGQIWE